MGQCVLVLSPFLRRACYFEFFRGLLGNFKEIFLGMHCLLVYIQMLREGSPEKDAQDFLKEAKFLR